MRRLWNRRRDETHAADWSEPRPEFLTLLADRVRATAGQRQRRAGRVQLAFAGVLALALLVAVSAFGGVGYAARQAGQAVEAVTGPFSSDSSQGTVGGSAYVGNNDGYDGKDKCKVLKKKLKQLKRKHLRQWRALLAAQKRERVNFPGRRGNNPAWQRLLAEQRAERRALKRKQRAERRELQKRIKKCQKGRR
jgi:hypothetical protein